MFSNQTNIDNSFLGLEDLILFPPLPAFLSLLIVLGTLSLSALGARWCTTERKTPVELAAIFVVTTGLLAAVVHGLAWAGYASVPVLGSIGWTLAAFGVLAMVRWNPGKFIGRLSEYWREGSVVERFALIFCGLTVIGLWRCISET
jgi:hypothetical protein